MRVRARKVLTTLAAMAAHKLMTGMHQNEHIKPDVTLAYACRIEWLGERMIDGDKIEGRAASPAPAPCVRLKWAAWHGGIDWQRGGSVVIHLRPSGFWWLWLESGRIGCEYHRILDMLGSPAALMMRNRWLV